MNEYRYRLNITQSNFVCGNINSNAARLILANNVTIINDIATTNEDTPVTGNVLTNDSGSGSTAAALTVTTFTVGGVTYNAGDTATIAGVGTIIINANGSYTFTPLANYNGNVPAITYTATDTNGGSGTGTLNITVTAVNDVPVATDDVITAAEDSPATGSLLANDTDVDGNTLTVTQLSVTVNGTVINFTAGQTTTLPGIGVIIVNADGTYTFTPNANWNGTVPVITYTISDGNGGTDTETLAVTITAVNDAPVAVNDSFTGLEDGPAITGNLIINDSDVDGGNLSVTGFAIAGVTGPFTVGIPATIPGVGTITVNSDGTFTFTPLPNYNGTVPAITYTVSDGVSPNPLTASATLNITVTAVKDAPIAANDAHIINEDNSKTFTSIIKLNTRSLIQQLEDSDLKRTNIEELGFKPKVLFLPSNLDQIQSILKESENGDLKNEYFQQIDLLQSSIGKSVDLLSLFYFKEKLLSEFNLNNEKPDYLKESSLQIVSRISCANSLLQLTNKNSGSTPITVSGTQFGLTVLNQNIKNESSIILHGGLNSWNFLENGAIVLRDNPKLGLTVRNQQIVNNSEIILHEGYNQWYINDDGSIVLRNNPEFGLTVLNQDFKDNSKIILHNGFNRWDLNFPNITSLLQNAPDPSLLSFFCISSPIENLQTNENNYIALLKNILDSDSEKICDELYFQLIEQKDKFKNLSVFLNCNSRLKIGVDDKINHAVNSISFYEVIQKYLSTKGIKYNANSTKNGVKEIQVSLKTFEDTYISQDSLFVDDLSKLIAEQTGNTIDIDFIGNKIVHLELTDIKRLDRKRKIEQDYKQAISQNTLELYRDFLNNYFDSK
jgi:CshA-type fibril repeat protein